MIEVKNVSKKYGNYVAVDNISFEVNDNEIVGFLGPNGAGKTTTMNMITGYIEPTSGRIIVDGFEKTNRLYAWKCSYVQRPYSKRIY